MAKPSVPTTLSHDFSYASDAELNQRISVFQAEHAAAHDELLAMDARRPLGAGRVRVMFRVRSKKGSR